MTIVFFCYKRTNQISYKWTALLEFYLPLKIPGHGREEKKQQAQMESWRLLCSVVTMHLRNPLQSTDNKSRQVTIFSILEGNIIASQLKRGESVCHTFCTFIQST